MLYQDNGVTQEREVGNRSSNIGQGERGPQVMMRRSPRLTVVHQVQKAMSPYWSWVESSRKDFFRKLNLIEYLKGVKVCHTKIDLDCFCSYREREACCLPWRYCSGSCPVFGEFFAEVQENQGLCPSNHCPMSADR